MNELRDEITLGSRTMEYFFRPAKNPSLSPTVVIFHGHQFNERPSGFRDDNWNVVVPMDRFGLGGGGSWYLGEHGEYFVFEMMGLMLKRIADVTGNLQDLYFWGSSMGGYAAIVHTVKFRAKACFAAIPQTWLLGSDYAKLQRMEPYFEYVLGAKPDPEFNDLGVFAERNLIEREKSPLMVISANRFDKPNYLDQQVLRFVNILVRQNLNFYLEVLPIRGHSLARRTKESLELMIKQLGSISSDAGPSAPA